MASAGGEASGPTRVLEYVRLFRGASIALVVIAHAKLAMTWPAPLDDPARLLRALIEGGDIPFFLVAGYLFRLSAERGFRYGPYLVGRWKNVIVPYLFCSIPALLHAFVFRYGVFENLSARRPLDVAAELGLSLLTAQHMFVPFWFIPTIALLYVAAPALLWIDRRPRLYALVPVAVVVGSMLHLSPLYRDVVRDAADVLPVYVAGMALHRFQAEVFGALRRFPLRLPLAIVALTLGEVAFGEPGRFASQQPFSTEGGVLDFGYLQKALLSLWVLERLEAWRPAAAGLGRAASAALGRLADLSFGVFFGHMYVQSFLLVPALRALSLAPRASWLGVATIGLTVLVSTTALIALAKRVLGPRSRILIGC